MAVNNLPLQLTNFIGRESEIISVERLLATTRLVTLTGVGGCGKTRLAIELANRVSQTFADGVWFVGLASLREASLVVQFVVNVFGFHPLAHQSMLAALKQYLQTKKLLLVLDNCEHLNAACRIGATALIPCSCAANFGNQSRTFRDNR